MSSDKAYHPESYWTKVGKRIAERSGDNVIAGDDEPFYRYKRRKFLAMLHEIDFKGKSVLEVGCGPGGNLLEIMSLQPKKLYGVDISQQMIELAQNKVPDTVELYKSNGTRLPLESDSIDMVVTATVLQHNTDEKMLTDLMADIARVAADQAIFFERVESIIKGDELCMGRPISYYQNIMNSNGFRLVSHKFINIKLSYLLCGIIRKIFNNRNRQEGEALTKLAIALQNIVLPISSALDPLIPSKTDLCCMIFEKNK